MTLAVLSVTQVNVIVDHVLVHVVVSGGTPTDVPSMG